jgi:benzoate transport
MSRAQVAGIAVTAAISALDGYDVLSVTFAAPGIGSEWGIGKATLGLVLGIGLLGMALGSILVAPLADRFGRRTMALINLCVMAAGMFACAAAQSVEALEAARLVTGLGIGAMVAVINPLAAEYANAHRRALAVGIMAIGYPVGGVAGGSAAAALLQQFDWRSVFILGGAATLALLPIAWRWLPESPSYLAGRTAASSLARLNALLLRFGQQPVAALSGASAKRRLELAHVLGRDAAAGTVRITAINFLYMMAVYFLLSWVPQIVVDAGFAAQAAARVSVAANLAGVAGGILLGWAAPRIGLKPLVVAALAGMGLATFAFGAAPADLVALTIAASFAGLLLFGGIVGLYAIIAQAFPAEARATGCGLVIGVGRGGSALAPVVAGYLFGGGYGPFAVSAIMGGCAILAAALLAGMRLRFAA